MHIILRIRLVETALPALHLDILIWLEVLLVVLPIVLMEQRRLMMPVNVVVSALLVDHFVEWFGSGVDLGSIGIHPGLVRSTLKIKFIVTERE